MSFLVAASILLLFAVPQSRAMIQPLVNQAEQLIDANIPLFSTVLLLSLGVTFVSWVSTSWPRAEPPESFRVIKRFRVQ